MTEVIIKFELSFIVIALIKELKQAYDIEVCEDCALSKAKAKKISKVPVKQAGKPGGRLCIDISSPSTKSIGGKCHWLLVVDDCTNYAWSFFLKQRSEIKDIVIALIKELKQAYDIEVKTIRCDNSGENNALQRSCRQEGLGITFQRILATNGICLQCSLLKAS